MSQLTSIRLNLALCKESTRLSLLSSAGLRTEYEQRGLAPLQVPREGQIRDLVRKHEQDWMIAEVNHALSAPAAQPPLAARDRYHGLTSSLS